MMTDSRRVRIIKNLSKRRRRDRFPIGQYNWYEPTTGEWREWASWLK